MLAITLVIPYTLVWMPLLNASGQIPHGEIALQTRKGRTITNTQSWNLGLFDWHPEIESALKAYPSARALSMDACPVYNCHGLTFGSRRTAVSELVLPILEDDGFTIVREQEAHEGDIAVYFEPDGSVSHTGVVVGRVPLILGGSNVANIWSKWGKGPEVVHRYTDCTFFKGEEYILFYRLTEWKESWR